MNDEAGGVGFIGMHRGGAELAVTTEPSPRTLAGVEPGPGPRHELFVYVEDVDATFDELRGTAAQTLREPRDMPWGERVAFVRDPEGAVVPLATAGTASPQPVRQGDGQSLRLPASLLRRVPWPDSARSPPR